MICRSADDYLSDHKFSVSTYSESGVVEEEIVMHLFGSHLDNQKELLMDAYRSMSHELHKLQVEEEMLMCRYHEFMTAQGFISEKKIVPVYKQMWNLVNLNRVKKNHE